MYFKFKISINFQIINEEIFFFNNELDEELI